MAVKKSYIFNKIINKLGDEMDQKTIKRLTKDEKKDMFLKEYFPKLPSDHKKKFYK